MLNYLEAFNSAAREAFEIFPLQSGSLSGEGTSGHHLLILANANSKWQLVNKRAFYVIYYPALPHCTVQNSLDDSYGIVSLCVSLALQMGCMEG